MSRSNHIVFTQIGCRSLCHHPQSSTASMPQTSLNTSHQSPRTWLRAGTYHTTGSLASRPATPPGARHPQPPREATQTKKATQNTRTLQPVQLYGLVSTTKSDIHLLQLYPRVTLKSRTRALSNVHAERSLLSLEIKAQSTAPAVILQPLWRPTRLSCELR
jgi:hypothetical protein